MKLRKSSIQFKFAPALLIIFTLGSFAICQSVHAVVPAPDGGYPNFTTAEGTNALKNLATGAGNTAIGWYSLFSDTSGGFNTAVGAGTLLANTGGQNTAIGAVAGLNLTTGSRNICIGSGVVGTAGENNTIRIGDNLLEVGSACYIGGIWQQAANGAQVVVDSNNKLGVYVSSKRFKRDIADIDKGSETILALRPVTFHYKSDTKDTPQFGLIAEEVAKVNPALVVPDKEGKPYTVRYDAVNAMLLNEFLKEHRKNQEQEATIARLEKQIRALTSGLQKVSAEVQVGKTVPQIVLNKP